MAKMLSLQFSFFLFLKSTVASDPPTCGKTPYAFPSVIGGFEGPFWMNPAGVGYYAYAINTGSCFSRFSITTGTINADLFFCNKTWGNLSDVFVNSGETRAYLVTDQALLVYDLTARRLNRVDSGGANITGTPLTGVWVNADETLAYVSVLASADFPPRLLAINLTTGERNTKGSIGFTPTEGFFDVWVDENETYAYLSTGSNSMAVVQILLDSDSGVALYCPPNTLDPHFRIPLAKYIWADYNGVYWTEGSTDLRGIIMYLSLSPMSCQYWQFPINISQFQIRGNSDTLLAYAYSNGRDALYNLSRGTCPSGTYGNTAGSCSPCPNGTYFPDNSAYCSLDCFLCSAGYASTAGAKTCLECSPGYYSPTAGSVVCSSCPLGREMSNYNATDCTDCPYGQIASETGTTSCSSCSAGTEPNANVSHCDLCPAGKSSDEKSYCNTCPENTYSQQGAALCISCPEGQSSDMGSGACSSPSKFDARRYLLPILLPVGVVIVLVLAAVAYRRKRNQARAPLDTSYQQLIS